MKPVLEVIMTQLDRGRVCPSFLRSFPNYRPAQGRIDSI